MKIILKIAMFFIAIYLENQNIIIAQNTFLNQNFKIKNEIEKSILQSFDTLLIQSNNGISDKWTTTTINKFGNGFDSEIDWAINYPKMFPITILTLTYLETEKNQSYYNLKFSLSMNSDSINNSIICIYNVIAKYNVESKEIIFDKYTDYYTRNWERKKVKGILYIKEKTFNNNEIKQQTKFNQNIAKVFDVEPINFSYYSCKNPKDVFKIMGFDYIAQMYFAKTGGLNKLGGKETPHIIYSGNNKDIYIHEVVHNYINTYITENSTTLAIEGIATFFGGASERKYSDYIKILKIHLEKEENLTLDELIFEGKIYENGEISSIYGIGAIITKKIYDEKGLKGLIEYLNIPKEEITTYLEKLFNINKNKLIDHLIENI